MKGYCGVIHAGSGLATKLGYWQELARPLVRLTPMRQKADHVGIRDESVDGVRLKPALIVGRVRAETQLQLLSVRVLAVALAGGVPAWVLASSIGSAVGRTVAIVAGAVVFTALAGLVLRRWDATAWIRYFPEIAGRRRRSKNRSPDRHAVLESTMVRPGQWIAPAGKYLREEKRQEEKAAERARRRAAMVARPVTQVGTDGTAPVVSVESGELSTMRPVTFRRVLAVTQGIDSDEIKIGYVGGDADVYKVTERFFFGGSWANGSEGTSDRADALDDLMRAIPRHGSISEASLLDCLTALGHNEGAFWHSLRSVLGSGLVTRAGTIRRLPYEIRRLFDGSGSDRPYPPRVIELTGAGRVWVEATTFYWQSHLPEMLVRDDDYVRIDFANDAAPLLRSDLECLIQSVVALSTAVDGMTEEQALLRELVAGKQVSRSRGREVLEKLAVGLVTGTTVSLAVRLLLGPGGM